MAALPKPLEAKVARALEARAALAEARLAARRDGRPADWYVARQFRAPEKINMI